MGDLARQAGQPSSGRSRYFIEAIERGLAVLTLFDSENPTLSLAEIARRSGSVPSTALRLVQTLIDLDFLEELPESGRYRPSLGALRIGHLALLNAPLRALARPVLERLHRMTEEAVTLAVLVGRDVVLIDSLADPEALFVQLRPGSRLPAYCTAIGKALLSSLPDDEVKRRIGRDGLQKLGPNTITSFRQLEKELALVRDRGFAQQDEELAAGMRSVAAPIRGGRIEAAVGLATPAARVELDRLRRDLVPPLVGAAAELAARLRAME